MEEGCEWLRATTHSLLNASDPKQRIDANEKLVKFQREPKSFFICMRSIYSPQSPRFVRIFASQSICYVCRKGPPDVVNDANNRQSMLKVLSDVRDDVTLFGNISIAFLCFLRSNDCSVDKFIEDIISVVQDIPAGIVIAHLLSFVPELCQRKDVAMTKQKRTDLPKALNQKQELIFQFCLQLLAKVSDSNDQCIILHCLTEWVSFNLLSAEVWQLSAGQALLETCFTELPNAKNPVRGRMKVFLTAVIAQGGATSDRSDFTMFLAKGVENLMNTIPNDAFEIILAFCNSNVQLMQSHQEQPFTLFIKYLLEVTRSQDVKKVSDCLDWWPSYCKGMDAEHTECILRVIAEAALYRDDLTDEDARHDFSLFRRTIRETFRVILRKRQTHIGDETIKFLLQHIGQTQNWRRMEMGLHFLSVLVQNMETTHVANILPIMIRNSILVQHRACRRLAIVAAGQITKFVPQNLFSKETIDDLVTFVCDSCSTEEDHEEFPFRIKENHVAAIFFMKTSKTWDLTAYLEKVFKTYQDCVAILFNDNKSTMSNSSLLVITEALCTIVHSLVGEARQKALHSTLRHAWQRLTFSLQEALRIRNDGALPSADVRTLCKFALSEVNHVTNKAADWNSSQMIAYFHTFFQEQWYILENLLKFAQADDELVEQACTILEQPVAHLEDLRIQVLSLCVKTLGETAPTAPWIRLFGKCIIHTRNYQLFGSLARTQGEKVLFNDEDTLTAWYDVLTQLLISDASFFGVVDENSEPIFAVVLNSTFALIQSGLCSKFSLQGCRDILKFFIAYQNLLKNNLAASLHQDRFPVLCIQCLLIALNKGFPSHLLEDLMVVYRTFFIDFLGKFEFWITKALEGDVPGPSTKLKVKKEYVKRILSDKSKQQAKYFKKITKGFCGGKKKRQK